MSADDVPLICDPVPAIEPCILVSHALSEAELQHFRRLWAAEGKNIALPIVVGRDVRVQRGRRTEWPDAEFCAA